MEILIVGLALGLLALVGLVLKFSGEESKWQKISEDSKTKKLADLEAEIGHRDKDIKKAMEERQKLEDEFFKVKDEADILKKENLEMAQKIKLLERAKEEFSEAKAEMKQRDMIYEQDTLARQKLQGELALKDQEALKLAKELEVLRGELKTKTDMFEGLKSQFGELESELQNVREGLLKKSDAPSVKEQALPEKKEAGKEKAKDDAVAPSVVVEKSRESAGPQASVLETKKEEPLKSPDGEKDKPKEDKSKIKEEPKAEAPVEPKKEEPKKSAQLGDVLIPKKTVPAEPVLKAGEVKEIPGFPKKEEIKVDLKQGVPKDTDFLKTSSSAPKEGGEEVFLGGMPQNFKLTNVNRPKPESVEAPKAETPKIEPAKPEALKTELPKTELPKQEPPQVGLPKEETLKPQAPKVEAEKIEPKKTEAPKVEPPKVEPPKPQAPKVEVAKVEPPKVEPPKPEPVKAEPPKVEPPKPEPAKEESLKKEPLKKEAVEKKPQEKDKSKSKRETLIDGFHPRPSREEPPA